MRYFYIILICKYSANLITGQATDQTESLVEFCVIPPFNQGMMQHLGLSHREYFRDTLLQPLIAFGKLAPTIPDNPSSPNQRYITVKPKTSKPHE